MEHLDKDISAYIFQLQARFFSMHHSMNRTVYTTTSVKLVVLKEKWHNQLTTTTIIINLFTKLGIYSCLLLVVGTLWNHKTKNNLVNYD